MGAKMRSANWGGKREGAGPPIKGDPNDKKEPLTVRIEHSLREKARKIGLGNITEGVREALRKYKT